MLTEENSSVKIESMLAERNYDLARRAAVHAALADPARLLITDTLLAGDTSPSELAGLLAMPSNLAHHLRVLEQAGIIAPRRSEGDRRRTYLWLIPDALDLLRSGLHGVVTALLRASSLAPTCRRSPALTEGAFRAERIMTRVR